jgi:hypothetical protein
LRPKKRQQRETCKKVFHNPVFNFGNYPILAILAIPAILAILAI